MLNNINSRGLSKSIKVKVLHKSDVKPESLIVRVGTKEVSNVINLLNNIKKIAASNNSQR